MRLINVTVTDVAEQKNLLHQWYTNPEIEAFRHPRHFLANKEPSGERMDFHYHFYQALFHYDQEHYERALDCLNQAGRTVFEMELEETGEWYFMLAAVYQRLYGYALSMKYCEKAMHIFSCKQNFRRMASCENLFGINNQDIGQHNDAENHYRAAIRLCSHADCTFMYMTVFHNIGVLHSKKDDPITALFYLKKANRLLSPEDVTNRTKNLYLLACNHFIIGNTQEASRCFHEGLKVAAAGSNETYVHRFEALRAKYLRPDAFETTYKKAIAYFLHRQRWEFVIEYGEELGLYYGKRKRFKEAYDYCDLAIIAKNKLEKERELAHD
ncbi:MAG TPA: hypothetical protein VFK44_06485 [Bacillales bacterium]|nr:hypothetical protein [Bacillales bacterium]